MEWPASRFLGSARHLGSRSDGDLQPVVDIDGAPLPGQLRSVKTLLHISVVTMLALAPACREGQANEPTSRAYDAAILSAEAFPALTGRVVDSAKLLSKEQELALAKKAEALEIATRHQLVIVTVPSLHGQDIAVFTRDLGRHWGVGRKGADDGVILLVAPNERKVRIAVGYGLEETLTSAICQQIIATAMIPRFREGNFAGGIDAGVSGLIGKLKV